MEKMAIVMQISQEHVIVLTNDGQFVKIPGLSDVSIGQKIPFHGHLVGQPHRSLQRFMQKSRRNFALIGLAACLAIVAGVWEQVQFGAANAQAFAFISLDAVPGVNLVVNKKMHVIDAYGTNQQGRLLLSHVPVKGDSMDRAIYLLVHSMEQQHLASSNDPLLVATAPASANDNVTQVQQKAMRDVKNAVGDASNSSNAVPIYAFPLSNMVWNAATSAKVSPARLAAVLVTRDAGMKTDLNHIDNSDLQTVFSNQQRSNSILQVLGQSDPLGMEKLIQQMLQNGLLNPPSLSPIKSFASSQTVPDIGQTQANYLQQGALQSENENSTDADVTDRNHPGSVSSSIAGGSIGANHFPSSNDLTNPAHTDSLNANPHSSNVVIKIGSDSFSIPLGAVSIGGIVKSILPGEHRSDNENSIKINNTEEANQSTQNSTANAKLDSSTVANPTATQDGHFEEQTANVKNPVQVVGGLLGHTAKVLFGSKDTKDEIDSIP